MCTTEGWFGTWMGVYLLVLQVFYMLIRIGSMHAQAAVSLGIQKQLYKVASLTPPFLWFCWYFQVPWDSPYRTSEETIHFHNVRSRANARNRAGGQRKKKGNGFWFWTFWAPPHLLVLAPAAPQNCVGWGTREGGKNEKEGICPLLSEL